MNRKFPTGRLAEIQQKAAKIFNIAAAAQAGAGLHRDLPLAYCLMLDSRAPLGPKAWFAAKFAFMAIDAPLPLVGEIDVYVAISACSKFIASCEKSNPALVQEHRAALAAKASTWDSHVAAGVDMGRTFGQAVAGAAEPVKNGVKRVATPVQSVVQRGIDRIRGID